MVMKVVTLYTLIFTSLIGSIQSKYEFQPKLGLILDERFRSTNCVATFIYENYAITSPKCIQGTSRYLELYNRHKQKKRKFYSISRAANVYGFGIITVRIDTTGLGHTNFIQATKSGESEIPSPFVTFTITGPDKHLKLDLQTMKGATDPKPTKLAVSFNTMGDDTRPEAVVSSSALNVPASKEFRTGKAKTEKQGVLRKSQEKLRSHIFRKNTERRRSTLPLEQGIAVLTMERMNSKILVANFKHRSGNMTILPGSPIFEVVRGFPITNDLIGVFDGKQQTHLKFFNIEKARYHIKSYVEKMILHSFTEQKPVQNTFQMLQKLLFKNSKTSRDDVNEELDDADVVIKFKDHLNSLHKIRRDVAAAAQRQRAEEIVSTLNSYLDEQLRNEESMTAIDGSDLDNSYSTASDNGIDSSMDSLQLWNTPAAMQAKQKNVVDSIISSLDDHREFMNRRKIATLIATRIKELQQKFRHTEAPQVAEGT